MFNRPWFIPVWNRKSDTADTGGNQCQKSGDSMEYGLEIYNELIAIDNALAIMANKQDIAQDSLQIITQWIQENPMIFQSIQYCADALRIISGLALAFAVITLLKYAYRFFSMFFPNFSNLT